MGSRFCENCNIRFPSGHQECEVCGRANVYDASRPEDADWQLSVEALIEVRPSKRERQRRSWRAQVLSKKGFCGALLELMVESSVDVREAERMVDAGCPPDLAARILL